FSSRRRHTRFSRDWSSDVCSSDLEDTQWLNLVLWGRLATLVSNYLKKGSEIAIEGKLVHRSYETANGEKRYITEINVNDLVMLRSEERRVGKECRTRRRRARRRKT